MSDELVRIGGGELMDLVERTKTTIHNATAPNTRRAYASDWNAFVLWCQRVGQPALPADPAVVACYIRELADTHKPASVRRAMSAIAQYHDAAGFEKPTTRKVVTDTWRGIRREHGVAQAHKAAATADVVTQLVADLPDDLGGMRDRALLLLGYAAALRRSELAALTVEDLAFVDGGVEVTIARSKTDQDGEGRTLPVSRGANGPNTCPVRSLQAWLSASGITTGYVFRWMRRGGNLQDEPMTPASVARIIKQAAEGAGLDPALFSGHSLRRGRITSLARAGVAERHIMEHSRHKSERVMRGYIEQATIWDNPATKAART